MKIDSTSLSVGYQGDKSINSAPLEKFASSTPEIKPVPETKPIWEMSNEEQNAYLKATYSAHRSTPYENARNAYAIVQREMKKTADSLAVHKPSIASKDWDFTMKDGVLVSTGKNLSAADHAYLDKQLNGNAGLVAAVGSLGRAAVAYLQTSDDNPSYSHYNTYTQSLANYTFDNVADQMNGKTQFKDLMTKTDRFVHPTADTSTGDEGSAVLDILSTMLTASPPPAPTNY